MEWQFHNNKSISGVNYERPQRWQQPPWGMSQERTLTMEEYKTCTKCGQTKPITLFRKDKRLKSGYGSQCKACKYAQSEDWVRNNSERKYAINAKYRDNNKDKVAAVKKEWQIANKEYLSEKSRLYREANKDKLREQSRQWRLNNKAKIAEANRAYRQANPERKKANDDAWWRNNPEKVKARNAARRARKKAASIYLVTDKDIRQIMSKPCFYCGADSNHLDHVVPLYRGGTHSIGNLVAACQNCNLSKGKKLLSEWRYRK
jgi:5-methylcytosine-specific restriction endonuclease McrA